MNTLELRDALRADADLDAEPAPTRWDRVQTRGTQIRRRRRGAQGAVALVSVVAIAAGVLAVTGTFSDGGGSTKRGVVATPPGPVATEIVAQLADRVAVISPTDGHVISTLATGIDPNLSGGVSATPDGNTVVYTRKSAAPRCGSELVERSLADGTERVIVGHSWNPLVSPDGQWVAYVINDSCEGDHPTGGGFVGLTNLRTGLNYRPFEQELGDHPGKPGLLAWSPSSDELVFIVNGQTWDQRGLLALRDLPLAKGASPVSVPGGTNAAAATFLPNGHLLVARVTPKSPDLRYSVDDLDASGHVVATRFKGPGFVGSIALDPSGTRLLVTRPDGTLLVQEGTGDPRPIASGVRSAAWLS